MGADDITKPEFQLGAGCLVDQLVGQFMARVVGLGYLVDPDAGEDDAAEHPEVQPADGHARALQPHARVRDGRRVGAADGQLSEGPAGEPVPVLREVMTGFEYTAAVGMLYEGLDGEGLQ